MSKCRYCGKEIILKEECKRPPLFCSKECHKKYYDEKIVKESSNHKCVICGKPAMPDYWNINHWHKTCGSEKCLKKAHQKAQLTASKNRIKFYISEEDLRQQYLVENKSREEIAQNMEIHIL